jgi:hypothetical protein
MHAFVLATLVFTPQKSTFTLPVINHDVSSKTPIDTVKVTAVEGFTQKADGEFDSKNGRISFVISRSSQPLTALQRKSNASKDDAWTTIRLVKWIGFRWNAKGTETYRLNWNRFQIQAGLKSAPKGDIKALRTALQKIVDSLDGLR